MDALEALLEAVKQGEGVEVEFKRRITRQIAHDIAAFANTRGGKVFIGVDDGGKVVGTSEKLEDLYQILQSIKPLPRVEVSELWVEEKRVLVVNVEKSYKLHTVGNVAYVRIGSVNRPLELAELLEKASEIGMVRFDELVSASATYEDLDERQIKAYLKAIHLPFSQKSLEKLQIVKGGKITNSALLLFSHHPHLFIHGAYVDFQYYGKAFERRIIEGTILEQWEGAYQAILEKLPQPLILGIKHKILVPKQALREALLNALIHRNYADTSPVLVILSEGTLKIKNPGSFPPGVTLENPLHKPRNPLISTFMEKMGYMERLGKGIETIFSNTREAKWGVVVNVKRDSTEVLFTYPHYSLEERELKVLEAVRNGLTNASQIERYVQLPRRTLLRVLGRMVEKGVLVKKGKGKNTIYTLPD